MHFAKLMSNEMQVVGVECVSIPKKHIWELNREFPFDDQKGVMVLVAEKAKSDLIDKLEVFEEPRVQNDLSSLFEADDDTKTS